MVADATLSVLARGPGPAAGPVRPVRVARTRPIRDRPDGRPGGRPPTGRSWGGMGWPGSDGTADLGPPGCDRGRAGRSFARSDRSTRLGVPRVFRLFHRRARPVPRSVVVLSGRSRCATYGSALEEGPDCGSITASHSADRLVVPARRRDGVRIGSLPGFVRRNPFPGVLSPIIPGGGRKVPRCVPSSGRAPPIHGGPES